MSDLRDLNLGQWNGFAVRWHNKHLNRMAKSLPLAMRTENTQFDFGWRLGGFTMHGEAYYSFAPTDERDGSTAHLAVSRTFYEFVRRERREAHIRELRERRERQGRAQGTLWEVE